MSAIDAGNARLTPDDRYELATRAQSQQRLNSPRHLILLGMLLLVIAFIVLGIAWQTRAAAIKRNELAASKLAQVEALIEEIQTLEVMQQNSSTKDMFEPLPDILSTLQSLGQRAQLENDIGIPRNPGSRPEGNAILKTYPYNINDPALENLIEFAKLAQSEIPGLQLSELELQPRNQYWSMSVVFTRYERRP